MSPLFPFYVEVLGYPYDKVTRCTYAIRRHLQLILNRIFLKVPKFQQTIYRIIANANIFPQNDYARHFKR